MNLLQEVLPENGQMPLSSEAQQASANWPPISGEYILLPGNEQSHVAVSTLASTKLAEVLVRIAPKELCIVGKTETENIGIEKIIKNMITNPSLHVLILSGKEPEGHRSGATLLSICKNGVDENFRVIGSPGKRPILKNVGYQEIEAFRRQVAVIDMIGCESPEEVVKRTVIESGQNSLSCSGASFSRSIKPVAISHAEVIKAEPIQKPELDKAGYFVILPLETKRVLNVEHYSNDNRLLRVIEGKDAVSLYKTIIENGWVTQLSHAAYLGKELERAELSMQLSLKYVQDGM
jgi:tetrahydromethanopterin S-methyltransferase subunit A